MAEIRVGDPVLVYGKMLEVAKLEGKLAVIVDAEGEKLRGDARKKFKVMRKEQSALSASAEDRVRWEVLRDEIDEISLAVSEALFILKLRRDLLTYWPERGVWVSEGRILSNDDQDKARKMFGDLRPDGHKMVYDLFHPREV